VDKLLQSPEAQGWLLLYGRDLVVEAIREALEGARKAILQGGEHDPRALTRRIQSYLAETVGASLRPTINAAGVILHTNLGRAPLSPQVLAAMQAAGQSYSNLEFDLDAGRRGSRYVHAERLLCRLTGAEAALVVNNNAGAVLLVLSALATAREVVISRGQLVEIGGGFRIPDVMAQSGAHLVEVGTTNRTYIRDYVAAIGERTAALLRVHSSNFRVVGFTAQPELSELVDLAREHGLLLLDDLGSGTLIDTAAYGLAHEPTIQESVSQGADLVTFSGDKLLGGPQAGIIVGRAEMVSRLKRHPLTRALRVDKTTLAGIQANLLHYVKGDTLQKVPVWRMISTHVDEIEARATRLVAALGAKGAGCELIEGRSMVGGGSLPEESLPTVLIALPAATSGRPAASELATRLRAGQLPIVPRIQDDRVVIDLRTVFPAEEEILLRRLSELL
jgi:L-seryl-tRNA(Ser) seleniumtransferase